MKQKLNILIIAAALAASCSLNEVDNSERPSRNEIWENTSYGKDSSDTGRKVCYMTAMDYPDGYDWRVDTEKGSVKCSLTVFADEIPIMKIPVGDEYEISSEPDMHRMIGGHIYTDYSTDSETVIKKDGKEIFRFDGREMILDAYVSGQDFLTLGCPRKGNGLTFRKNGTAVFQKNNAVPFNKMLTKNNGISFAFREIVESGNDELEKYWLFQDSEVRQIAARDDIQKVWDIIIHNGEVCYIADIVGIDQPVLVQGETLKVLDTPERMQIVMGRMFSVENAIATELIYTYNHVFYSSGIWVGSEQYWMLNFGTTISGLCTWENGIYCMFNSNSEKGGGLILRCGEALNAPEGYTMIGNNPICVTDGILRIGLSSLTGEKPIIWKDGITSEIDINGYICTLTSN